MSTCTRAGAAEAPYVLAGDIGGTNARLALVALDGPGAQIVATKTYESRRYPGLGAVVRDFLVELPARPAHARYAIAGPVRDGRAHLPNLDWDVSAAALARDTGIRDTRLLNDFDAVGHAVAKLGADDFVELQAGSPAPRSPTAIIGAGTGLGQAFLIWAGDGFRVCGSEGGHADFAARSRIEHQLSDWLHNRYGHASWERVVSGRGLVNIYRFLAESGYAPERPDLRAAVARDDAAAEIAAHGLAADDELCAQALALFVSAYGAQAGNFALTVGAGTVYLAGGIAPKLLGALKDARFGFLAAFRDKGRFTPVMDAIAVRVIINPRVGLIGAAASYSHERTGQIAAHTH